MVGLVLLLVVVNLPALFDGTLLRQEPQRPEAIPEYWRTRPSTSTPRATRRGCSSSRGPTSPRTAGATPSTRSRPGLMDRPYVARELIPYGTAGTADLLNALDRRFQERIAGSGGFAALLRRMGVGDVVDAQRHPVERYNLVAPREIDRLMARTPGSVAHRGFGTPTALHAPARPRRRGRRCSRRRTRPARARRRVSRSTNPTPIVRAESTQQG